MKTINMKSSIHFLKHVLTSCLIVSISSLAIADSSYIKPIVHEFSVDYMHQGEALITLKAQCLCNSNDQMIVRKNTKSSEILSEITLDDGRMESLLIVDHINMGESTSYTVVLRTEDGSEREIKTISLSTISVSPETRSPAQNVQITDPHNPIDWAVESFE